MVTVHDFRKIVRFGLTVTVECVGHVSGSRPATVTKKNEGVAQLVERRTANVFRPGGKLTAMIA